MAAKQQQQQQQQARAMAHLGRGGVAVGAQKAAAGARGGEGKNSRRALEDIGNTVTSVLGVAVDAKINRPITRSFGAQLLANAQAAAAKKVPAALPVAAKVVPKPARKPRLPPPAKPSPAAPEFVIEISSSSEAAPKPARKAVATMTAVLTARSKMACGLTDRPKAPAVDEIDAGEEEDQLAVVEYVEDIYAFYKLAEACSRPADYMPSQPEINARMRAILVDWIIEVHLKFELTPEALYLTVYIIDKFLSSSPAPVSRSELQLTGVAAMLIACKYEEVWAPEVNDFIAITDGCYCRDQILAMEKEILNALQWYLTVPTAYVFLRRFAKAAAFGEAGGDMEETVNFFAEMGLMEYRLAVAATPSRFAAAAVLAARCTLGRAPRWTPALRRVSGYEEEEVAECARVMVEAHAGAKDGKLKVVCGKYGAAARRPPATVIAPVAKC